jgi:DNA-binding response OmpR family regulator
MLPDLDGLEVLRRMRADTPDTPVLFLTGRDAVEDRIAGLTAGGDDYVTKPFSLEELVARLRGLLRRSGTQPPGRARSWSSATWSWTRTVTRCTAAAAWSS